MKKLVVLFIFVGIILLVSLFLVKTYEKYISINSDLYEIGVTTYPEVNYVIRPQTLQDMEILLSQTFEEELTKKYNFITGLSTYLNVEEQKEVEAQLNNIIVQAKTIDEFNSANEEMDNILKTIINNNKEAAFQIEIYFYLNDNFTPEELKNITIGITNLNTKQTYTYNSELTYYSASTIKVPINMYVYDLVKKGEAKLSDEIIYTEKYYEGGTGIMQHDAYGTVYTLDEVLTNSIVYSDNVATNMLIFNYFPDPGNLTKELEKYWGYCNLDYNTTRECNITNHLNSLTYLYDNSEKYPLLIEDMKNGIYKSMIPAQLDVEVANKTGNQGGLQIDDAIVYAPVPYAISITFIDIENNDARMADLSKYIYDTWIKYFPG